MTRNTLQRQVQLAIIIALSVILGIFIQLKTPTGFITLLDAGIYFAAFYFGKKEGAIVGGLSGFLIDLLLGYPQWMLVSLFAHGAQGYLAGTYLRLKWLGLFLSCFAMVGVYFLVSVVYYNVGEALASVLGNSLQSLVGLGLGYALARTMKKRLS